MGRHCYVLWFSKYWWGMLSLVNMRWHPNPRLCCAKCCGWLPKLGNSSHIGSMTAQHRIFHIRGLFYHRRVITRERCTACLTNGFSTALSVAWVVGALFQAVERILILVFVGEWEHFHFVSCSTKKLCWNDAVSQTVTRVRGNVCIHLSRTDLLFVCRIRKAV